MNGACDSTLFWPHPLWPWGVIKRSNIKFQLQSQFQGFLYQTLCVFSQMKDTKHIRQDFILLPGSCPRGWGLALLGVKNLFFSKHGHVAYQIEADDERNIMHVKLSPYGQTLVTLGWFQRSNFIKLQLHF